MTPVGATCGPTSETFCGRGQGECFAQGGPHVDSLSDHRAGHGTFGGGRWGWRGSHESCSVPLYPVRFLHAGPRLSLKRPGPARPLGLRPALAHCRERRFLPSPACDVQPRPEAVFPAKSLPGFSVASGGRAPMPSLLYGHRQNPSFSRAGFHFRGDGSLSHFHVLHRFGANDGTDWRMNNIRNKTASLS